MAWHNLTCPSCKLTDDFRVEFIGECRLTSDGSEDGGNHEWDETSRIWCGCGWQGMVGDCQPRSERAKLAKEKAARVKTRKAYADGMGFKHRQTTKAVNGSYFHIYDWPRISSQTPSDCTVLIVEEPDGRWSYYLMVNAIDIQAGGKQLRAMAAAMQAEKERGGHG